MEAQDPTGVTWQVRVQWLPRYEGRGLRERLRQHRGTPTDRRSRKERSWLDVLDVPVFGESPGFVVAAIAVIAVVIVLALFGLPFLLATFDLVVVVLATISGIVGRVLFRRPWTVEAISSEGHRAETNVVGWGEARRARDDLAADIRHGRAPQPT